VVAAAELSLLLLLPVSVLDDVLVLSLEEEVLLSLDEEDAADEDFEPPRLSVL
jgi:hypothetical protein